MIVVGRTESEYRAARTYADRGASRILHLRLSDNGSSFEILNEEHFAFETNYSRNEDKIRLLVAPGSGSRLVRSFLKAGPSHRIRNGTQSEGEFFDKLDHALSAYDLLANPIPRRLADPFQRAHPLFNPPDLEIAETALNGTPVYQIHGPNYRAPGIVTVWIDRETRLILALEKILRQPDESLIVATTIFRPAQNATLTESDFSDAESNLKFHLAEWNFPAIDATAIAAKLDTARQRNWEQRSLPQTGPRASTPPLATSNPLPSSSLQQLSASEMSAIVLIEGESGQGTGFVTRINETPFVITNLHVLAGAKTLRIRNSRGETLNVLAIHAARGHDIALIRVSETSGGLQLAKDAADSQIGDSVVVVGNRLGGGVLTQETGRLLGIGPDRIEVNAKFQPGNSGSPIVNTRTGEVIGVATYLQTVSIVGEKSGRSGDANKPSRESSTRWFGYRFDSVSQWERIDWNEWQRQSGIVRDFSERSNALLALLRADSDTFMANPQLRNIVERYERRFHEARLSEAETTRQNRSLITDLINFCRSDLSTLEGNFYDYFRTSDYFDTSIPLQRKFREEISAHLQSRERDFHYFR